MGQRIAVIVGLAFWFPFLRGEFFASHFSWPVQSPFASILFNGLTFAVVAIILVARQSIGHLVRARPCAVAALVMVAAGCLLPFANKEAVLAPSFTVLAMTLTACAFCMLGASWGTLCVRTYPSNQMRTMMLDIAIAYTASFVTAIPFLSAMAPGGTRTLCLVVSGVALYICTVLWPLGNELPDTDAPTRRRVPREVVALITVYVTVLVLSGLLVGTFIPAGYTGTSSPLRTGLSVATAIVLVIMMLPTKHPVPKAVPMFCGAFFILVGALLAMSGIEPLVATGSHILTAGRRFLWILLWIVLVEVCATAALKPVVAFGCLFPAAFAAARMPVNALRIVEPAQHLTNSTLYMASTTLSICLVGCALVLAWLEALRSRGHSRIALSGAQRDAESVRKQVSLELAIANGLTERECAVLELLSRGYTVKRIADELCVSENTVRAHTKAIYRKIGCHSKQELVDLVELRMGERDSEDR